MSAAPAAALAARPGAGGRSRRYVPLFNIGFRHGYYDAPGANCRDFRVVPTPDCARLLASLRMVFQDLGTGFSVQIEEGAIPALFAYLRQQYRTATPGAGYWTWLSFLLHSTNPGLIGITRLPITTNLLARNLYASNLAVSSGREGLRFQSGSPPATGLLPLSGNSLTVPSPDGATPLLTDIGGAAVPVASSSNGRETCFAMRSLPYGCYTVGSAATRSGSAPAQHWLYLPTQPQPFGLIDLLLARPDRGTGVAAAFPIVALPPPGSTDASAAPTVTAVNLTLAFEPRPTYWNYYICSQDKTAQFGSGLHIVGKGTRFDKSSVRLPNGDPAILFAAERPLPLQQRSDYHFALAGDRKAAAGNGGEISVPRLPASAATPVWPAPTGDELAGLSEIYVYV